MPEERLEYCKVFIIRAASVSVSRYKWAHSSSENRHLHCEDFCGWEDENIVETVQEDIGIGDDDLDKIELEWV